MLEINSIDPAPGPNGAPSFLVDWMTTRYCNLDCSYCDAYSHDNHSSHPNFEDTKNTIDFIYEYVDLYMTYKRNWQKGLVLNIYGGESMVHPDIVRILKEVRSRHKSYKDKWPLLVQITSNLVIGPNTLSRVIDLVDDWTFSFHSESLPKQQELALKNLKFLHDNNKQVKCIIMMHAERSKWNICLDVIEFCKKNKIKYTVKALDTAGPNGPAPFQDAMSYDRDQMEFIKNYWMNQSSTGGKEILDDAVKINDRTVARSQGRACCGGRSMCINQNHKNRVTTVPLDNFTDWHCSVNWYFLHVNQTTGEIYNNKDCRISLNNIVEPVGYLSDTKSIIDLHRTMLETKSMPVIKCINKSCHCGMCAPKAKDLETFKAVMKNHWTEDRCLPNTYTHPTTPTSQEKLEEN